jgi:hypothetical protein
VWEGHRRHEELLELRLGSGLDLDDGTSRRFELGSRLHRQQRTHSSGAGGIADRAHRLDGGIGNQPKHQGV